MTDLPEFYELFKLYKADPESKDLRFGQWFIVRYARDVTMPELFYESSNIKSARLIYTNFYRDTPCEPSTPTATPNR